MYVINFQIVAIKKIRVENFKSFKKLEIELGKFNVLIGPNASGKSNFIQIFQFLKDIANSGLDNAISMHGSVEYLKNINIDPSENLSVSVVFDHEFEFEQKTEKGLIGIKIYEAIYEFAFKFRKGWPLEFIKEKLTQKCNFVSLEKQNKEFKEKEKLGKGEIVFSCTNGKMKIDINQPSEVPPIKIDDIIPPYFKEDEKWYLYILFLLLEHPLSSLHPLGFKKVFSDISIYDFDPKLLKKITSITGKAELEKDGSNLSIVLKNIIEDKDKKRKLFNLVKDLLPFIDNLDVVKLADNSLLFKLQETYSKNQYLPASLISDGTINMIAVIIALYFKKIKNKQFKNEQLTNPLTIIEEPDRNIHPYLISKVVNMMKDASQEKQVIVTTHNPEIVKYAGLENILLVSRDNEGFSTISRPADNEEVKIFLKNEIGIEELHVQNLLGI